MCYIVLSLMHTFEANNALFDHCIYLLALVTSYFAESDPWIFLNN